MERKRFEKDFDSSNLFVDVTSCPHGVSFCPYKNVDDDVCIECLHDIVFAYRCELVQLRYKHNRKE